MDYTIKQKRLQIAIVLSQRSFTSRFSLSNVDWKRAVCNPGERASRDAFSQEKRPSCVCKQLN